MQKSEDRLELVSRIVIFLPIIIVVILVAFSSTKPKRTSLSQRTETPITSQQSQTKQEASVPSPKSNTTSLDLKGPYYCDYQDENITVTVSVKNRNVFAHYIQNQKENNILINGDCGYSWEQGKQEGVQMCGIGQYLSLAEMFSSMGLDNMFSMMGQMGPSVSIAPSTISAITNSCKKQEVSENVFTIPTNIIFAEEIKP